MQFFFSIYDKLKITTFPEGKEKGNHCKEIKESQTHLLEKNTAGIQLPATCHKKQGYFSGMVCSPDVCTAAQCTAKRRSLLLLEWW